MNLGRGLRYVRDDANWVVKVLIGSLLSLFPIVSLAATAYMYEVVRNVATRRCRNEITSATSCCVA